MTTMNEAWGAVIAAIAAGIFGIGGILAGIYVGRRQTTHQATVEHGQWLRDQRQQAYLAFIATWDTSIETVRELQEKWEARVFAYQQDGTLPDPAGEAYSRSMEAWQAIRRDLERVELLGPQRIDFAVQAMEDAFRELQDVIGGQVMAAATCPRWDEWHPVLGRATQARYSFHAAAIQTLRQPPSPDGEREGLEEE
ncbi:hypothetical protein [Streptomyces griseofuscus]|uniref:hypothetical protein n=1 Tax=Streptomyces griseofuscus TaxID=146922 RepID=UPI0036837128